MTEESLPTVERRVLYERQEDMSVDGKIMLMVEEGGDIGLSLLGRNTTGDMVFATVEFCSLGGGGGRSPHTRRALHALIVAVQRDNAERPIVEDAPAPPRAPQDWQETVCLDVGGAMFKISVGHKIFEFEMHPRCGPALLDREGRPKAKQPAPFLKAASLWDQQGRRMEDGLCRWDHPPEAIRRHLGGNHYEHVGEEPPVRGE